MQRLIVFKPLGSQGQDVFALKGAKTTEQVAFGGEGFDHKQNRVFSTLLWGVMQTRAWKHANSSSGGVMSGNDCIFCRIIKGEIPCAKVYEDAKVLAFLDLGPVRPGHTLVIPKSHHMNLLDTPNEDVTAILAVVRKVGKALMDATGAEGFNVLQNNFSAAGQQVFHAHWHVIPRGADDGLYLWPQGAYGDSQAMSDMAKLLAARMVP